MCRSRISRRKRMSRRRVKRRMNIWNIRPTRSGKSRIRSMKNRNNQED